MGQKRSEWIENEGGMKGEEDFFERIEFQERLGLRGLEIRKKVQKEFIFKNKKDGKG